MKTQTEALKLALEGAANYIDVLGGDGKKYRQLLAQQSNEQVEPTCWITPDGEGFRMRMTPPVNDVPLGWTPLFDHPPAPTAQPKQESQKGGCTWCGGNCPQFECDTHSTWMNEPVVRRDLPPQPKEPEQEPVAWLNPIDGEIYKATDYEQIKWLQGLIPLTTPPQRPSRSDIKPLTDEEIIEMRKQGIGYDLTKPFGWTLAFARAIEAAHGIKE